MEDFELLVQLRQEFRNQQDYDFIVFDKGVQQCLPILVLVVVQEHCFNVAKVAALLFLALNHFIFERLDIRFHFVRLKNATIINSTFAIEFSNLSVEKL